MKAQVGGCGRGEAATANWWRRTIHPVARDNRVGRAVVYGRRISGRPPSAGPDSIPPLSATAEPWAAHGQVQYRRGGLSTARPPARPPVAR